MNNEKTKGIVMGAFIAALYAVLTYISAAFGIAYGPIQFRLSEALCILPLFTPYAIPGLVTGCIISNIGSSLGPVDMLFGTAATFLAAALMHLLKEKLPYPVLFLFPVLSNAVIVGAEIALFFGEAGFVSAALSVALGEAVVIFVIGTPLYHYIKKHNIFK